MMEPVEENTTTNQQNAVTEREMEAALIMILDLNKEGGEEDTLTSTARAQMKNSGTVQSHVTAVTVEKPDGVMELKVAMLDKPKTCRYEVEPDELPKTTFTFDYQVSEDGDTNMRFKYENVNMDEIFSTKPEDALTEKKDGYYNIDKRTELTVFNKNGSTREVITIIPATDKKKQQQAAAIKIIEDMILSEETATAEEIEAIDKKAELETKEAINHRNVKVARLNKAKDEVMNGDWNDISKRFEQLRMTIGDKKDPPTSATQDGTKSPFHKKKRLEGALRNSTNSQNHRGQGDRKRNNSTTRGGTTTGDGTFQGSNTLPPNQGHNNNYGYNNMQGGLRHSSGDTYYGSAPNMGGHPFQGNQYQQQQQQQYHHHQQNRRQQWNTGQQHGQWNPSQHQQRQPSVQPWTEAPNGYGKPGTIHGKHPSKQDEPFHFVEMDDTKETIYCHEKYIKNLRGSALEQNVRNGQPTKVLVFKISKDPNQPEKMRIEDMIVL